VNVHDTNYAHLFDEIVVGKKVQSFQEEVAQGKDRPAFRFHFRFLFFSCFYASKMKYDIEKRPKAWLIVVFSICLP